MLRGLLVAGVAHVDVRFSVPGALAQVATQVGGCIVECYHHGGMRGLEGAPWHRLEHVLVELAILEALKLDDGFQIGQHEAAHRPHGQWGFDPPQRFARSAPTGAQCAAAGQRNGRSASRGQHETPWVGSAASNIR